MKITKTSGLISGTSVHSDTSKTLYQGVILQKGTWQGGQGYFMTNKPKVLNYAGESGAVQLMAK